MLRPDEYGDFRGSDGWMFKFLKRHSFSIRRKTNGKTQSAEERKPGIQRFHAKLRQRLIKDQPIVNMHDKVYGAYQPQRRYNVDQVPLPLFVPRTTINQTGARRVAIKGTRGDDSEKRFCTLQTCVRLTNQVTLPNGKIKAGTRQPKLTICFRGTGKRIKESEKQAYHPDVNVQFQVCGEQRQGMWHDVVWGWA